MCDFSALKKDLRLRICALSYFFSPRVRRNQTPKQREIIDRDLLELRFNFQVFCGNCISLILLKASRCLIGVLTWNNLSKMYHQDETLKTWWSIITPWPSINFLSCFVLFLNSYNIEYAIPVPPFHLCEIID